MSTEYINPTLLCFINRLQNGYNIWEILTSHNIIRLPNYIKGVFTFALISYPVDESFSNLIWRLFIILSVFDLKQAKSEIPRLYAIFQLKLCLSTKMKPLFLGTKITICPWNFRQERLNFCFKNGSKNKHPLKCSIWANFWGVLFLLPFLKQKLNLSQISDYESWPKW